MSNELVTKDATALAELIRNKDVSPVEVMRARLERIDAVDPKINAIVAVADNALESAKAAEAAVLKGDKLGPLHGVPFRVCRAVSGTSARWHVPFVTSRSRIRCSQARMVPTVSRPRRFTSTLASHRARSASCGWAGLSWRFGTSREGLPIGVQIVSPWLAESTSLHLGALLEGVSPVRNQHPDLSAL